MDIKIKEVEVQKLNLKPNDILVISLTFDENEDPDFEGMAQILDEFRKAIPDNKVMAMVTPTTKKAQFSIFTKEELDAKIAAQE